MTTALIGLLGGVLGASITGVLTYILQRAADERRFKHENDTRLREERTKAYGVFFSLARGARAASHRSQTLVAQPGEPTALEKLRDARATVELLRERPELEIAARKLYGVCTLFLEGQQPAGSDEEYLDARNAFLAWARYELGLTSEPPPGFVSNEQHFVRPRPKTTYLRCYILWAPASTS